MTVVGVHEQPGHWGAEEPRAERPTLDAGALVIVPHLHILNFSPTMQLQLLQQTAHC